MDLPIRLRQALDACAADYSLTRLKQAAEQVSDTYRKVQRNGARLVTDKAAVVSYALSRMPATFGAVSMVLKEVPACQTMLDVGAGTGAATWAALEMGVAQKVVCLEREAQMRDLGQRLMNEAYPSLQWQAFDLVRQDLPFQADLVVASYMLNELSEPDRINAIQKLWQGSQKTLVLVEAGTPMGFGIIRQARDFLIKQGGFIIGPCPHSKTCPMSANDWCHFSCRVARSKLHKALKSADAPYEDEKFSYLIVSRQATQDHFARVLRHPQIDKGKVELQLCTVSGLQKRTVTRKESTLFKAARKSDAGDKWKES